MNGNEWLHKGLAEKSNLLLEQAKNKRQSADLDEMIGYLGREVSRSEAAYDAGFEAGVLATEAGLGRAETA